MKCFILDDERPFCHQLRDMLHEALGQCEVHIETTFESTVEYLRAANSQDQLPDLLFCDYRLGKGQTGLDLLELLAIQQITVPSILLTDLDDPDVIERARQLGVPHFTKTGLNSAALVRDLSFFAFQAWAEQRRRTDKELRRQSERMLLLAAEIAHEFKSVMTATNMQVGRIVRKYRLDALTYEVLEKMFQQLQKKMSDGLALSEVLLTYGKLKGRRATFATVELDSLLKDAISNDDSTHRLTITLGDIPKLSANIDEFLVRRILAILLKNVVDHCPSGAKVRIAAGEIQHENTRCLFVDVQDDGPGVSADLREKIFDPGERGGKEIRYHAGSGLGLGLSFARVLTDLHAGPLKPASIRCIEPVEFSGANFRIIIPQE